MVVTSCMFLQKVTIGFSMSITFKRILTAFGNHHNFSVPNVKFGQTRFYFFFHFNLCFDDFFNSILYELLFSIGMVYVNSIKEVHGVVLVNTIS